MRKGGLSEHRTVLERLSVDSLAVASQQCDPLAFPDSTKPRQIKRGCKLGLELICARENLKIGIHLNTNYRNDG